MHNKLLLVYLMSFGDDPQQALAVLAGVGPQGQTVFYGDTFQRGADLSLFISLFYTVQVIGRRPANIY